MSLALIMPFFFLSGPAKSSVSMSSNLYVYLIIQHGCSAFLSLLHLFHISFIVFFICFFFSTPFYTFLSLSDCFFSHTMCLSVCLSLSLFLCLSVCLSLSLFHSVSHRCLISFCLFFPQFRGITESPLHKAILVYSQAL